MILIMISKKYFYLSIFLWFITLGIFGYFFFKGMTSKSSDQRMAIKLLDAEKDLVLGEMRTILKAVNGILKHTSENNLKEASLSAKSAGMGMAQDINPIFMAKLPLPFKQMGMGLHAEFDKFSSELEIGMNEKQVLFRLGEITNKCIACHQTYRFSTEK